MGDPTPLVTVLMPVYNGARYVNKAIESILHQTYSEFEFIIINDGSTDDTAVILTEHERRDRRLRIYYQVNQGVAVALNKGLELARGVYIARMDADDISLPERLARQVAFMDAHPQIGICGTWYRTFGNADRICRMPQDDAEIRCELFFSSPIAHPTAMLRRHIVVDHTLAYPSGYGQAEDYAFWEEAAKFTSFANLPEVLLHYRVHIAQVTSVRRAPKIAGADKVRVNQLAKLGINTTDEMVKFHLSVCKLDEPMTREFVMRAESWIRDMQLANRQTGAFPEPAFSKRLDRQWFAVCRSAVNLGMFSWHSFWRSPLSHSVKIGLTSKMKFRLLCTYPWLRSSSFLRLVAGLIKLK